MSVLMKNEQMIAGLVPSEGNSFGTPVDLSSTSSSNVYTVPSDGFLYIDYPYATTGYIYIVVNGMNFYTSKAHNSGALDWTFPVRKGMTVYLSSASVSSPSFYFIPYV